MLTARSVIRVYLSRVAGRTLSLNTTAIIDDSTEDDPWFLVFEPATGVPRIALRRIDQRPLNSELVVTDLPSLSATIALVRTEWVDYDELEPVLYAEEGFSSMWRLGAQQWYGGLVASGDKAAQVVLTPRTFTGTVPTIRVAGVAELGDSFAAMVLVFGAKAEARSFPVPCGRKVRITADGLFRSLVLNLEAQTYAIDSGEHHEWTVRCTTGGGTATVSLAGQALGAAGANVVIALRQVTP